MLIFNCTKAAQDFFTVTRKGKKQTIVEAPPCKEMSEDSQYLTSQSETPTRIQQWMLHAVSINRKHCLVAVEVSTRFSVTMAGLKKADLDEYLNLFKTYLSSQVLGHGNEVGIWDAKDYKKIIKETLNHFAEAHFFRRYDSSVQARINTIVQDLRYWADVDPELLTDEDALLNFNWRCNRLFCKSKAFPNESYIVPREEMLLVWQQLYQKATPKQLASTRDAISELEQNRMEVLMEGWNDPSPFSDSSEQSPFDESKMIIPGSESLNTEEMTFLDETLFKYETELSLENVSSLHGFLTAVVSGPNMLPPSQWLPEVWGGEEWQPDWEDMNEAQRFMGALFTMMNGISETLMNAPERFSAMFIGDEHYSQVSDWCVGYMGGADIDEQGWDDLPANLLDKMDFLDEQSMMLDVGVGKSPIEQKKLCDEIVGIAQELHAYWLKQRSPMPPGRQSQSPSKRPDNVVQFTPQHPVTGQKIGRNEPCPCGSGKKFKKCCLH